MFKRIKALAAAVILTAGLLGLSASPVAAASSGNCTAPTAGTHYGAAEWFATEAGGNGPWGIEVYVNHSGAFEECVAPAVTDQVASQGYVAIAQTSGPGMLAFGVVECRSSLPGRPSYCDDGGASRIFVNLVECDWPNNDRQYDLGSWLNGDPKLLRMEYGADNNAWKLYIDGVYQMAIAAGPGSGAHCLNPEQDDNFEAGVSGERWDIGDGWGTPTDALWFTQPRQETYSDGTWYHQLVGATCDAYDGEVIYEGHSQFCETREDGYDQLKLYTEY